MKIADDVPLDVACVIGCAVQTGVGAAINTAGMEAGATALVLGLGGIGLSVVQGAVLAGASRIIVSDPVAERREAALAMGATDALDPTTEDVAAAARRLTGDIGVDYAFDALGRSTLITTGLDATRKGGTTVLVGVAPIDDPLTLPITAVIAATEKKLVGCLLGSSNSLHEIPRLIAPLAGRADRPRGTDHEPPSPRRDQRGHGRPPSGEGHPHRPPGRLSHGDGRRRGRPGPRAARRVRLRHRHRLVPDRGRRGRGRPRARRCGTRSATPPAASSAASTATSPATTTTATPTTSPSWPTSASTPTGSPSPGRASRPRAPARRTRRASTSTPASSTSSWPTASARRSRSSTGTLPRRSRTRVAG